MHCAQWPGATQVSEMNTPASEIDTLPSLRQLAAAPHRLLFLIGAANILLAMLWWTLWLLTARLHLAWMPQPPIPAGWAHAIVMQYQVLPPFMFGFLLTVFPRWMGLPALTRWHYLPVGIGLFGGQLLTLIGLCGYPLLLQLGLFTTIAGWLTGLGFLITLLFKERESTWHAISCAAALTLGLIGLMLAIVYLHLHDARLMFAAIKFGGYGLLLPIYVTVAHRMFPFFASAAVPGHKGWRPLSWLAVFWPLCLAHLGLELIHGYAWLWIVDLPLLVLTSLWLWKNWPRSRTGGVPILLRVLFLGYAWLPLALILHVLQSAWFALDGAFVLGRAPGHALFIGFFGSILVAMVTRVTQGHSGRLLEFGRIAQFAFLIIQVAAVVRIVAELRKDALIWQIASGSLWLLAFLPWVVRSSWIYLTPRRDGQPG